jgi:hypothetical protein
VSGKQLVWLPFSSVPSQMWRFFPRLTRPSPFGPPRPSPSHPESAPSCLCPGPPCYPTAGSSDHHLLICSFGRQIRCAWSRDLLLTPQQHHLLQCDARPLRASGPTSSAQASTPRHQRQRPGRRIGPPPQPTACQRLQRLHPVLAAVQSAHPTPRVQLRRHPWSGRPYGGRKSRTASSGARPRRTWAARVGVPALTR